jgi:2-polyprenyl-3-methyl-5-hydroxy-6-metoxy-1,4-benzoquinol methylase
MASEPDEPVMRIRVRVTALNPRMKSVVDRVYRMTTIPPRGDDLVEVEPGLTVPRYLVATPFDQAESAERYFRRLPDWLDLTGKRALDVGCGQGELCILMAKRGASRVVGVDLTEQGTELARVTLRKAGEGLPVELRTYGGDLRELGDERFDVVVSKDSFEHYGAYPGSPDADGMVRDMANLLVVGGLLVIGFGPLWKSPFGGHIDTKVPWAHLVFPEEVIFDEFRRVRPPGKTARTFEEGVGVNRMSLARFRRIMADSGLECLSIQTNMSDNPKVKVMREIARIPVLEEYFTHNVFGIWRRPPEWQPDPRG